MNDTHDSETTPAAARRFPPPAVTAYCAERGVGEYFSARVEYDANAGRADARERLHEARERLRERLDPTERAALSSLLGAYEDMTAKRSPASPEARWYVDALRSRDGRELATARAEFDLRMSGQVGAARVLARHLDTASNDLERLLSPDDASPAGPQIVKYLEAYAERDGARLARAEAALDRAFADGLRPGALEQAPGSADQDAQAPRAQLHKIPHAEGMIVSAADPGSVRQAIERHLSTGGTLRNADLRELDLSGMNLERAELAGANLAGTNLSVSRLVGADLRGATMQGADLGGADLTEAKLDGARLDAADLRESLLTRASFRDASLAGARLDDARAFEPRFHSASLPGASLDRAALSHGTFRGADLTDAHLRRASLDHTVFVDARLDGADLRDAILARANFASASLVAADLEKALLAESDFKGARLDGANLTEARLGMAYLREASCEHATFERADLSLAELRMANLERANLVGADLREAGVADARLLRADLTLARTEGARFTGADMRQTLRGTAEDPSARRELVERVWDYVDMEAARAVTDRQRGRWEEFAGPLVDYVAERGRSAEYCRDHSGDDGRMLTMRAARENPDLGARVDRFAAEETRERDASRWQTRTADQEVSRGNGYTM